MKCEWKKYKIGDLCSSISETYKGKHQYVVTINTSDVLDGEILNHSPIKNDGLKGQFKKTFQQGDILYSEIRPANRRFAFVNFQQTENYIASTKLMVIRANKNIVLPEYLFAFLKLPPVIEELQMLAETRSGTFPQITFSGELAKLKINLPDMQTQKKIVDMLRVLEDKIAINGRILVNIQQQAQVIFKSWFVDFEPFQDGEFVESELGPIPKGWRVGELSEVATITMGQSPSGKSYNEEGNGSVFFQGRAEFGNRFPTRRLYTTEPKRMAEANSVLMSVRAPVGDINVAYEKCCIGRGLASIQSKFEYSSYMLYQMLSLKRQLDVFNGEGTVFGSINRDTLNAMKVLIPDEDSIEKFECIVAPVDKLVRTNYDEICRLEILRDTLLPKLMSGELSVNEVQ